MNTAWPVPCAARVREKERSRDRKLVGCAMRKLNNLFSFYGFTGHDCEMPCFYHAEFYILATEN